MDVGVSVGITKNGVSVGTTAFVGVDVGVLVGSAGSVGVEVGVSVAMAVFVGVFVAVAVGEAVLVEVAVGGSGVLVGVEFGPTTVLAV